MPAWLLATRPAFRSAPLCRTPPQCHAFALISARGSMACDWMLTCAGCWRGGQSEQNGGAVGVETEPDGGWWAKPLSTPLPPPTVSLCLNADCSATLLRLGCTGRRPPAATPPGPAASLPQAAGRAQAACSAVHCSAAPRAPAYGRAGGDEGVPTVVEGLGRAGGRAGGAAAACLRGLRVAGRRARCAAHLGGEAPPTRLLQLPRRHSWRGLGCERRPQLYRRGLDGRGDRAFQGPAAAFLCPWQG